MGHLTACGRTGVRAFYGRNRVSMRGKGMTSRRWEAPVIQARVRSSPMPKPEWGTLPAAQVEVPVEGV